MKYFLIFSLFIITSCASSKNPYSYFVDCEIKFTEFANLSSCALKNIQKDCNSNTTCRNEKTRFVDAIKRLQIMLDNNEISDNEAMFRYYNLIDFEKSKFTTMRNIDFSNYHYYSNNHYVRGISSCYFSRTGFCY